MEKISSAVQFLPSNEFESGPNRGVSPQVLSKLHILPFGRICANTNGSARRFQAGFQGVPSHAWSLPFRGGGRRVIGHFFDFLPACLANLGNTPRRGAKNGKLNQPRFHHETAFEGGASEAHPQK